MLEDGASRLALRAANQLVVLTDEVVRRAPLETKERLRFRRLGLGILDLAAEPLEHLAHLDRDHTATDNDQGLRNTRQVERRVTVQGTRFLEPGEVE